MKHLTAEVLAVMDEDGWSLRVRETTITAAVSVTCQVLENVVGHDVWADIMRRAEIECTVDGEGK